MFQFPICFLQTIITGTPLKVLGTFTKVLSVKLNSFLHVQSLKVLGTFTKVQMAAKTVFNSCDLLRHIYSFGDPTHRESMRLIAMELHSEPYDFTDEFSAYKRQLRPEYQAGCSLLQYLDGIPQDRLLKLLPGYMRCYCCKRHNLGKPTIYQGQVVTFTGVVHETHTPNCECACRHFSRKIITSLF